MIKRRQSGNDVLGLARDLADFGGRRTVVAIALMILSGFLESLGLALLVPMFSLLTTSGNDGAVSRIFHFILPGEASTTVKLAVILVLFMVVMAIRTIVLTIRDSKIGLLQLEYSESLQVRLLTGLGAARWQDIEALKHARITQALGGGIGRVTSAAQLLLQAGVSFMLLVAQWLMTLLIAPKIALIFLLVALVGLAPMIRALNGSQSLGKKLTTGNLSLVHTTSQLLGGLKLSFAQNMQPAFVGEYVSVARELKHRRYAFQRGQSRVRAVLTLGAALAGALLLFVGFTLGTPLARLLASFAIFARMNTAALSFIQCSHQLANNAPAHSDLMTMFHELELSPAAVPAPRADTLPAMSTLEFDTVSFGDAADPRLSRLSVVLRSGQTLGVSGPSGAGKTTFLDAVCGLALPTSGTIRLNGIPMDEAIASQWRDRISYVTQDCFLLNESIRRNLVWGGEDINDDLLWEALSIAQIDGVVRRANDGLDTEVNERGIRFSGGERQRLALARAILRRPEVLILDEATSAIDIDTEITIFNRLALARPSLTIIVVAHRASTLGLCDRIIRLEDGSVVDDVMVTHPKAVAS